MAKQKGEPNPFAQFVGKLKWSALLTALAYGIMGVVLLLDPGLSSRILCYAVGITLTLYGLYHSVLFFVRQAEGSVFELIVGLIALIFGIYALANPGAILSILSMVLGFLILLDSARNLQRALTLKSLGMSKWWIPLLLAIAVAILAIFIIFNPVAFGSGLMIAIGCILLYQCISDLLAIWQLHRLGKAAKHLDDIIDI